MLTELLGWGSKYPGLRRPFMQLYRRAWRVRRATLAKAVLVIQNDTGGVLMFPSSGALRLPFIDLHAWEATTTQVEAHAREILNQNCNASLVAVEGTPSLKGVTFLYSAAPKNVAPSGGQLWVQPKDAASPCLTEADLRLLHLCRAHLDR
jgi:hypothetical protein